MKRAFLALAIISHLTAVTAVTATYTGEIEKEGPQTDFKIGYASDTEARIELEIPEREGLNISYENEFDFDPDDASKTFQRGGRSIPLIEKRISIKSGDIISNEYRIPVTLQAFRENTDVDSTRPEIVQERDFSFRYFTAESPDLGFEGKLINSSEDEDDKEEEPDETLNLSEENTVEENTITKGDSNSSKGSGELESGSGVSPVLALAVILVFGYTIYEAFT